MISRKKTKDIHVFFLQSELRRFFASLRMTSEGLRMTSEGFGMTGG